MAIRHTTTSGGTWSNLETYNLAGVPVGVRTGGTAPTASTNFTDSEFVIFDNNDETKEMGFEVSAITSGTKRIITMPDSDVDLGSISTNSTKLAAATSSNTANTIVERDASGIFSAGTISAYAGSFTDVTATGQFGVGTATPVTSAAMEILSTSKALLLSRMSIAQRDALTAVAGMLILI